MNAAGLGCYCYAGLAGLVVFDVWWFANSLCLLLVVFVVVWCGCFALAVCALVLLV